MGRGTAKAEELVAWTLASGMKGLSTCCGGGVRVAQRPQTAGRDDRFKPPRFLSLCSQLPGHSGFHGHTLPLHHVPGPRDHVSRVHDASLYPQ